MSRSITYGRIIAAASAAAAVVALAFAPATGVSALEPVAHHAVAATTARPAAPVPSQPVMPVESCADLTPQKGILAGHGFNAQVESATVTTFNGAAYCEVKGYLAPQTSFKVLLPQATWMGNYLQEGCGGSCGSVGLGIPIQSKGCLAVTGNQLVLAANDLGHEGPGFSWAGDDLTMRVDYAYLADHHTALLAKTLIGEYYGQPPSYSYFDGCSTGGYEALMAAQRYPHDYNGILGGSPVANRLAIVGLTHLQQLELNSAPDGGQVLTAEKLPALHTAVMAACANSQGYIPDPRACTFNPASIQCPTGTDNNSCLTQAQVAVVTKLYQGPETNGKLLYFGLPFGSELKWQNAFVDPAGDANFPYDTSAWTYTYQPVKYGYLRTVLPASWSPTTQPLTLNWYKQLMQLAPLWNATDPDLKAFEAAGGKMILYQPGADQLVPPQGTIQWYGDMASYMGGYTASQQFSRLYLLPSGYHCEQGGSGAFQLDGDLLSPLTAWVEHNQAPASVTFPVTNPAAGQPASLTVAPLNPFTPVPGHGLNNNASIFIGAHYSTKQMWCSTGPMGDHCVFTSRGQPAPRLSSG